MENVFFFTALSRHSFNSRLSLVVYELERERDRESEWRGGGVERNWWNCNSKQNATEICRLY